MRYPMAFFAKKSDKPEGDADSKSDAVPKAKRASPKKVA